VTNDPGEPAARKRAVPPKLRQAREVGARFEDVVDVAAELFSKKGYAGTSVQDVADAVGMLKGSLYHYINTKEDLLYAVIQEAHHDTAARGNDALSLDGDAFDKLSFIVDRHLRGADARLAKVRVFYREAASLSPGRLSEVIADRDTYEHSLRKIIILGQAEGTFAPHLDPTLTSIAILALLNSVQQWFRPDGPRTLDDVIDAFTDLILRSVALNSDMAAHKRSGRANPTKDTEPQ
jgi:AcrR family transcriptional regulator